MEATDSSEMSIITKSTLCHIPEDSIIHSFNTSRYLMTNCAHKMNFWDVLYESNEKCDEVIPVKQSANVTPERKPLL
jgi:hypothetical protein